MKFEVVKNTNNYGKDGFLIERVIEPLHPPFDTREEAIEFYNTVDLPEDKPFEGPDFSKEIIEVDADDER